MNRYLLRILVIGAMAGVLGAPLKILRWVFTANSPGVGSGMADQPHS